MRNFKLSIILYNKIEEITLQHITSFRADPLGFYHFKDKWDNEFCYPIINTIIEEY